MNRIKEVIIRRTFNQKSMGKATLSRETELKLFREGGNS
jgi:hypothetical protein